MRRVAAERLFLMQHPMIDYLERAASRDRDIDGHGVRAALGVLDRTGLGPTQTFEFKRDSGYDISRLNEDQRGQLEQLLAICRIAPQAQIESGDGA